MAEQYDVSILDGLGVKSLPVGQYTVTHNTPGYTGTIAPANVTIDEGTPSYPFTVSANGTLNITVTDDAISNPAPIIGAQFMISDSSGKTYGTAVTTNTSGVATFSNVPYAATGAPTIFYVQTASDGAHDPVSGVQQIRLTSTPGTTTLVNPSPQTYNFTYTDANYSGLPIRSGTITLN